MCQAWTQEQWRENAAIESSPYNLLGEFRNKDGQIALQIADGDDNIWNIYSTDGRNSSLFYTDDRGTNEQRSNEQMARRGFTAVASPAAVTVQVETPATTTATADDGVFRYQGKTLAEWQHEGELNEDRDPNEHVHPTPPEGRTPTEQESLAFINSLTSDEALFAAFGGLMGDVDWTETETASA